MLFGSVAGILGLALATPMTAMVVILVHRLYVEDALGKGRGSEEDKEESHDPSRREAEQFHSGGSE